MDIEKYMIPCISKTLFGVECLGCGFQRAFVLLLQGKFGAAFQMYPAIFSSLIFLFFLCLHFLNQKYNYKKRLLVLAIANVFFMIGGYYYKYFL